MSANTIINGDTDAAFFDYPPDLDDKRVDMYGRLVKELRSLYSAPLTGDLEQIATACRAAMREEHFAMLATEHLTANNLPAFDVFTRHARAEAALKRQTLLSLCLIGEQSTRRADGARNNASNLSGAVAGGDHWTNLLPTQ